MSRIFFVAILLGKIFAAHAFVKSLGGYISLEHL